MKVLIVEDERSIANLIAYDLKTANFECKICLDGQEGIDAALKEDFDVYIVDWMMPKKDGIEVVKQLRAENKTGIIFMLTAKDEEDNILEAFEAGVDDYLTKPFSPRILLARIQAHTSRMSIKAYDEYELKGLSMNLEKREVKKNGLIIDLTKKEFDLLELLFKNKEKVLSRDVILDKIWNFDYDGDTRIVDVHIFKLRSKISDSGVTIKSSRGIGYKLLTV